MLLQADSHYNNDKKKNACQAKTATVVRILIDVKGHIKDHNFQ